jgi:acetyltransferase-like isoleucine patch superfamily enzyme
MGDGAVIGAGAVVVRISPYAIAVGSQYRFKVIVFQKKIQKIIKLEWCGISRTKNCRMLNKCFF